MCICIFLQVFVYLFDLLHLKSIVNKWGAPISLSIFNEKIQKIYKNMQKYANTHENI